MGALHFKLAQNDKSSTEDRNAELKRAQQIFEMLSSTSPFKETCSLDPPPRCATWRRCVQEQAALSDKDTVQSYDSAIKTLRGALFQGDTKEAPAVPAMQAHFLFNPMQAQLGRLYWMRGVQLPRNSAGKSRCRKEEARAESS